SSSSVTCSFSSSVEANPNWAEVFRSRARSGVSRSTASLTRSVIAADRLTAVATAQGLIGRHVNGVADKLHRPVHEPKITASAPVPAPERESRPPDHSTHEILKAGIG